MKPYVAEVGTVTERDVLLAVVTVPVPWPNRTILFAGVELKSVPVIVTVAPALAESGLNDVIVCASAPAMLMVIAAAATTNVPGFFMVSSL